MKTLSPNKTLPRILKIGVLAAGTIASNMGAAPLPLDEENSWKNPEFVKRFMSTYAVETKIEPEINEEESEIMLTVADLAAQDDITGAIEYLEKELKFESSAALDYTLANLKFQSEREEEAIKHYTDATRKFSSFLRAYKNLGLAQVQQGKYKEAVDNIARAIELGSEGGSNYGLLGYCYLNLEKYSSALDAYSRALLYKPDSMDLRQGKAQCLFNLEKYTEAIGLFDELIAEKPDNKDFWGYQANAYLAVEQTENASANLEIVRRMGVADASQLMLLGDLHMNHDAPFLAVDCYMEALEQNKKPDFKKAFRAGQILASYSQWNEAAAYFNKLQTLYNAELTAKDKNELLNLDAQIKMGLGKNDEAAEILKLVVIGDPLNGRALIQLGQHLLKEAKKFDEVEGDAAKEKAIDLVAQAIGYFEDAAKIEKFKVEALTQHAQVLVIRKKEYGAAVKMLEEAQRIKYRDNVEKFLTEVRKAAEYQEATRKAKATTQK